MEYQQARGVFGYVALNICLELKACVQCSAGRESPAVANLPTKFSGRDFGMPRR